MKLRMFLRSVLLGAAAVLVGLLVKLEYCMAGDGYGFPAAIIHPSHQEWWLVPLTGPSRLEGLAFDARSLVVNLVFLSLLGCPLAKWLEGRRTRASQAGA